MINTLKRYNIDYIDVISIDLSGIYFLFNMDALIYIGRSFYLKNRLKQHLRDKEITSFSYIENLNQYDCDIMESFYIKKYKPKLNILLTKGECPPGINNQINKILNDPFHHIDILPDYLKLPLLKRGIL